MDSSTTHVLIYLILLFRIKIEEWELYISIPPEYGKTNIYKGTLGHKTNHNFEQPTTFQAIETARLEFFELKY